MPETIAHYRVDARADLFACGAVLFEMLTGRPAFQGASPVEALHSVLHDNPPALVGSPGHLVCGLIRRAGSRSPARRLVFQTLNPCD